jgi:ribosome-interacting GTPase 1
VDRIPVQVVDLPPLTADYREPWLVEIVRNCDLLLILLDLGSDEILEHWEALMDGLEGCRVRIDPPAEGEEHELGVRYHRAVLAANKADLPDAEARLEILLELIGDRTVLPLSLETGQGVDGMLAELVRELDVIRVYTKQPGGDADYDEPFVLKRGSTVEDAARSIHKELAEHLSFARAWGKRFHDGQPVGRDTVLEDGDLIEFHE